MRRFKQVFVSCTVAVLLSGLVVVTGGCGDQEPAVYQQEKGVAQVAYPQGYRNWTHVKSMVILEGHKYFNAFGGFHHVYANDKAFESLKRGGIFSKGSILVFELHQALTEDNTIAEGDRLVIGVMEKDHARFSATEGWGFEDFKFKGNTVERAVTDARKQCLSCHEDQKTTDYVYSAYRE